MRRFFFQPFDDLFTCLERLLLAERPGQGIVLAIVSLVVTWFVYVPIHELLHVLGCVITGGTVNELQIAPQYGGAILSRLFPFVVSGGEYAGRLSGFDWKGSDLIYLATDLMPYVLSILIGVPLIKACTRRRRPVLFGAAMVLGFAPIINLIGDYYEMGSIVTTRAIVRVGGANAHGYLTLRSDDVFKLLGEVLSPSEESTVDRSLSTPVAIAVILASLMMGALFVLATYAMGGAVARVLRGPMPSSGTEP